MNEQTNRSIRSVLLRFSKATFMAGLLPALVLIFSVQNSFAGSATWNLNPTSNDWETAANWTPNTVPDDPSDMATFDVSSVTTLSLTSIDLSEIIFNPGASNFMINAHYPGLNFYGAGITNNSGVAQQFVAPGEGASIHFYNSSTAGEDTVLTQTTGPFSAEITQIAFHDTSSAGSATLVNEGNAQGGSGTFFYDSATAANGTIINKTGGPDGNGGYTQFFTAATAGSATLIVEGGTNPFGGPGLVYFYNRSTAGNATFTVNASSARNFGSGLVQFNDNTSAGNATFTANGSTSSGASGGTIILEKFAKAGNATFILNGGANGGLGGKLAFYHKSVGGTPQVRLFGNGTLDLSLSNSGTVSIGSLTGDGRVLLGPTNLTVGTNNRTTEFDGYLLGASLTKTGSGNLTLTGANDYTDGTIVQGRGTLFINNVIGGGTGTGTVQVNSGVLGGNGIISGPVVVGNGSRGTAKLMPGKSGRSPAVLTIGNTLTFSANGDYLWLLDTVRDIASSVVTKGVTIDNAVLFTPVELQSGTLSAGTVFTVINNAAATSIFGTFSNLPDGSTITVGTNTFQANYEGGDGNDLTLTVVP